MDDAALNRLIDAYEAAAEGFDRVKPDRALCDAVRWNPVVRGTTLYRASGDCCSGCERIVVQTIRIVEKAGA